MPAQGCRCEDEYTLDTPTQQHFRQYQPRFNRLAKPHVISDKQANARHTQGFEQRYKLVILHTDATVKRTGDRLAFQRPLAIGV